MDSETEMNKKNMFSLAFVFLLLGLLSLSVRIQNVHAPYLVITIEADGSISPQSANITTSDNVTYTFTANMNASIIVQRSNIVIDGNGWTLDGLDFAIWEGLNLTNVSNVTIVNVNIERFASYSILLNSASECVVSVNTVSGSEGGIGLFSSTGNTVSNNLITGCVEAVELVSSTGNNIAGNNMSDSSTGVRGFNATDNAISENSMTANSQGIYLVHSSNSNTITRNNITEYMFGVQVWNSSGNAVSNNHITGLSAGGGNGVEVLYSGYNIVSENYVTNHWSGVQLYNSSDNTIAENNLPSNYYGVYVTNSSGNLISANNITANGYSGVYLIDSTDNTIWRNDITNNSFLSIGGSGIVLDTSSNNILSENSITANHYWGINPANSENNIIFRNNVINNRVGINFDSSDFNVVSANNIINNVDLGIYLETSANNAFNHNNLINNPNQVVVEAGYANSWDDGVEGNYWSNYTGVDMNHDGIGDSPHLIISDNTDNYPLMGMSYSFNTSAGKCVSVVSNSTVTYFNYAEAKSWIIIQVRNATVEQTSGFCRISIPHNLTDPEFTWVSVFIDDGTVTPLYLNTTLYDNGTHRWIYVAYRHPYSLHEIVVIIPEFPSFLILPLFMIATVLATLAYRRRQTLKH